MLEENHYKQQQEAVIELYDRYIKNREIFEKRLNVGDGLDDEDVKDVADEVEKLKANKYLLAIVGESKSGKSAFINAFLGKPLLPTGVLQCTSGIIEIVDTGNLQTEEKVYLKVRYGDQPENAEPKVEYQGSLNSDITPLQKKLEEIAALREDYRALPTHHLNESLLGRKPTQITDSLVKELCSDMLKEEANNPHKLSKEEFAQRVRTYLEDYRDLTRIPVNIQVGYPVGLKFAHIRIIDTPGVNALGGLKTATVNYIKDANAAIFIHLLKNIASESLRDFIKKNVFNESHKSIFMLLTHKAHHKEADVEATLKEARKLYPEINPERIIAVDSMLKQMADELAAGKSLETLLEEEEREQLISKYVVRHQYNEEKIPSEVFKDSNFSTVKDLLTNFSEQALVEQLQGVVQQIAGGYEQQRNVYDEHIRLIGWRTEFNKTPEQFDSEIGRLGSLLEDYKERLNKFSQRKTEEYTGRHSTVNQTFSTMKEVYNRLLEGTGGDKDQVRKHIIDFNDECDAEVTRIATKLRKEYEAEMDRVGAEFKKEHQVNPPKINLESISEQAKKQAYETVFIPGDVGEIAGAIAVSTIVGTALGFLMAGPPGAATGAKLGWLLGTSAARSKNLTPPRREEHFSDEKFKEKLIEQAQALVRSISDGMPNAISNLFSSYDKQFKEKLGHIITERQNAYEQLKKDKEDAEKRTQLETGKNAVGGELKKIEKITEQLSLS